jgi:hypothetical protein
LQKWTARLILDEDLIAPFEPLFKQLGSMSIEQRIKYHKYLFVSKCLKNEAPIYEQEYGIWTVSNNDRKLIKLDISLIYVVILWPNGWLVC